MSGSANPDSPPKRAITRATGIALVVIGLLIALPSGLCTAIGVVTLAWQTVSAVCCRAGFAGSSIWLLYFEISIPILAVGYAIFRLGDWMYRK